MPEPDDQQLLREFAETNSEAAFAAIVARHVNLVYSTALRFSGNPQRAEEISQAVFIILARKAKSFGAKTVLSGWLYQTARLTAANVVKSEIRRQRREQEAYMQSTLNEPDAAAWEQIAPLLDDAMGRLGETDRNAVVLRFFENKTAREVAAALQLTEAAAHKRVNRALDKLRKFFAKRGVTLAAAAIAGAVSANSVHAAPLALAKSITAVALAQGAAASTSTLTLVKGALKIMAWTKAKTAIVACAVTILAVTSTTIITVKTTRARRPAAESAWTLSPTMQNLTADIQRDGTILFKATMEETNNAQFSVRTDTITSSEEIDRMTDEFGKPMRFTKQRGGYHVMLNRPVPPGGRVSFSAEGSVTGMLKPNDAGEYALGFEQRISANPATGIRYIQLWQLPPGAVLLEKNGNMLATTNADRVELRIDKRIPANGSLAVGFRYRLAAN